MFLHFEFGLGLGFGFGLGLLVEVILGLPPQALGAAEIEKGR